LIERRYAFLIDYQNEAYAKRYRARVDAIRAAEQARVPGSTELTEAVARYLFKVMAAKDEFEVARLYTDGAFQRQLDANFEGDLQLFVHIAPNLPFLQRKNDFGGSRKWTFGPWMFRVFKLLASLKALRHSPLNLMRNNPDRVAERKILSDYEATVEEILERLGPYNHSAAVAWARAPEKIRGFGHIKARHIAAAELEAARLAEQFRHATPEQTKLAAE
jgi:indolepyruvate ferredoxin oxidoreductase